MHDVIIVGGGISGSYLATLLDGLDVLLIEKSRKCEFKDSGIVSKHFEYFFPRYYIQHEIREMNFVSPSGKIISLNTEKPFAYIIDKLRLVRDLRRGVEKKYEEVKKVSFEKDCVKVTTNKDAYACKLLVGCDGANSLVRRACHIAPPNLYLGILAYAKRENDGINVYFNKYFSPDFFSWNIGFRGEYGLITSIRPKSYFKYFKRTLGFEEKEIVARPIPVGIIKTYSTRCLLVGDAAAQTKPFTGGGIIYALKCCLHAAKYIRKSLERNRFDEKFLSQYDKSWKKELKMDMKLQFFIRKRYRFLTNKHIEKIFADFKKPIENLKNFDYDKIASILLKLPKLKLFKHLLLSYL